MNEHERPHPTTNQPLNAAPRPVVAPLFAVLAVLLLIAAVFLAITWLRYHT